MINSTICRKKGGGCLKRLIGLLCCLCLFLTAGATATSVVPVSTVPERTTVTTAATTTTTTTTTTTESSSTGAVATTKAEPRVCYMGLYDAQTLVPLYEHAADERLYPASITKITTAYTALRYVSPETVFTVGSELSLVKAGSSICRIQRGHRLMLRDLIAGLMISSGNDAAYTIAVGVARLVANDNAMSDEAAVAYFCDLMNQTSRELGATHSHYVNPDGWDNVAQYSTVRDIALMTRHAMGQSVIREVVSLAQKTVAVGENKTLTFRSTNSFLNPESKFYDARVNGFKTGSTNKAGKCLVVTFSENTVTYIGIVANCATDTERYRTMQQLMAKR